MSVKKSGKFSEYFYELIEAGFVRRNYTWSISTGVESKLSRYRISDNYLRYYLKYILPNKNKILRDAFVDAPMSKLPGWDAIVGLQFENMILNNRKTIYHLLKIDSSEIVYDNPYFQRKTTKQEGLQIDYLIQTTFNCLYLIEIKFSRHPIKASVIEEVQQKIVKLNNPKRCSIRTVLIHINGVSDELMNQDYFSYIIDFGDMLNPP